MPLHSVFRAMDASASALNAERLRMTAAAENMAHSGDTTKGADGLPYARQRVHFQTVLDGRGQSTGAVEAEVVESARYRQFYDPDHPDADPDTGIVVESDIDPILEFTDLMMASRAYEANVNMVRGLVRLHEQALRLGEV
jgi:flagellar basal-body rod protein FlgC